VDHCQHAETALAGNSSSDFDPAAMDREIELIDQFYDQLSTSPDVASSQPGPGSRPASRSSAFQLELALDLLNRFRQEPPTSFRDWLSDLADRPFGEAQIVAGYGLAAVARGALDHVRADYLTPWSGRDLGHRLMAVTVLWAMADDELLANEALSIAISWTRQSGPERAVTAAIALGGPLGLRHPTEALRWLWALTLRDEPVSRVASLAIGQLFALEIECQRARNDVARFLLRKVRSLTKQGTTTLEQNRVLSVVDSVLEATKLGARMPTAAMVLRSRPGNFESFAEMWATALNSVPHRRRAVVALHLTLAALADDARGVELAAQLGTAILPRLTARTIEVLDLTLPDPQRTEAISAEVITAFFGAWQLVVGAL